MTFSAYLILTAFFVYIEYLLQVPAHKGHEVSKDRCKYAALNSIS